MEIHLKYDISLACKVILKEHLEEMKIPYQFSDKGTVEILGAISADQSKKLETSLKKYGIELIDGSRSILVQQIKEAVQEIVYKNLKPSRTKLSDYLSNKMNLSYSYLSKVFSEETDTPIENYMIVQRVEYVKQLIAQNNLTVTEIAWKLNYSSVAHLSNQFKKTTGLTPTLYQQLIYKRHKRSRRLQKIE